jgi:Ca2+-binding RTX toxin-like protein
MSNTASDEFDFVLVGGDGTDTLVTGAATTLRTADADTATVNGTAIEAAATNDVANANFAISGVEQLNITAGDAVFSSSTLTGQTIAVIADGDTMSVVNDASGGAMDLSGLSIKSGSTATLNYYGSTGADVVTGGSAAENIEQTAGADTIDGSTGTDTFTAIAGIQETGSSNASTGTVINMSNTAYAEASVVSTGAGQLGGTITEVASNSFTYIYAAAVTGNDATVSSIANVETVVGTTGADIIIGSSSDNTFTGGTAADTLTGGAGADNFVMTSGLTMDTITDFTAGTDNLHISVSAIETANTQIASTTIDLVELQDASAVAALDTIVVQEVADQATGAAVAAAAGANVFVLLGETYASVGAMVDGIETGDHELTTAAGVAVDDGFLAVWSDGTNSYLSLVNVDSGGTANFAAGELAGVNLAKIDANAVIAAGEYVAADFAFIA